MLRRVRYHIATYSGIVYVNASPDDDRETIIAKARGQLRRQCGGAGLPFGSESWRVLDHGDPDIESDSDDA